MRVLGAMGPISMVIQTANHKVQQTVHHFKAGQTHQTPMSNMGDQEESLGDGTEIYCESSNREI